MQSCDQVGCEHAQADVWGYWTSTPKTNTSDQVWCMCNTGCLSSSPTTVSYVGIRPVVSVSKVSVF